MRKKLRVGEFRELGFELSLQLRASVPAHADHEFWNRFIVDCIERHGLPYGGADTGYVTRAGRGSVSVEDRQAVGSWLVQRPEVSEVDLGPLDDVWYPGNVPAVEITKT